MECKGCCFEVGIKVCEYSDRVGVGRCVVVSATSVKLTQ